MNNIKDFLYEGILDDIDLKADNSAEIGAAIDNALYNKVVMTLGLDRSIAHVWDKKTKTLKIKPKDYTLYIKCDDRGIYVYGNTYRVGNPNIYTSFKELVDEGVRFDCDLRVTVEAIDQGLKLSKCGIVGKNHKLDIFGHIGHALDREDVDKFIDINPACFDTLSVPVSKTGFNVELISKFKYVIFKIKYYSPFTLQKAINSIIGIKAKAIYIGDFSYVENININLLKQLDKEHDLIEKSKYTYTKYTEKSRTANTPLTDMCKSLITQNPSSKILIGARKNSVLVWMNGDDLNYKLISTTSSSPWKKV